MPHSDADRIFDDFLQWVERSRGHELYPAQEEAVLELMAGRHIILNTPTGSGKSLVADAVHFKALAEGKRSFYTSPIKALVSEKFFALCRDLGADKVGMLTGDASINPRASVVCCTAEILANIALRQGAGAAIDYVVMDEFHYYADRERGMAWQVPLLVLSGATFVLMSATLGDMDPFAAGIERLTGRPVAVVRSDQRPVPLDFTYSETPLHETIAELVEQERAPVYLVNFTQRECAEQAQNLTSLALTTKEEKKAILDALSAFRFDTPYGRDVRRFVRHGVGIHHAGLLPKYRLLVEKLAQDGMLKVISGTDTLGVGVNIPIRTVLFTRLCKFDGRRTTLLKVRDFKQIAGRAGRKGFDDRGSVVAQAPEHVIENKRLEAKAAGDPKKRKKLVRKKPPERGYVHWDEKTFQRLIEAAPEGLESRFRIDHGTLLNVLDREIAHGRRDGGYRRLVEIIARCYDAPARLSGHRRHAAQLFRNLRAGGIIELVPVEWARGPAVRVSERLQREFSLFQALALYLVDALFALDRSADDYPLEVLSLVESIVEDPEIILRKQVDQLKGELVAGLKADGLAYEERMERLEQVTHPQPSGEFIRQTFEIFRDNHPWVGHEDIRPKSIARDMIERYATFNQYVGLYGLQRSEGVLLRYLTEVYKTLVQTVPDEYKTEEVHGVIAFLRSTLQRTDSSLVREWEAMLAPAEGAEGDGAGSTARRPFADERVFRARVRAEIHALVKALAEANYEDAVAMVAEDADDPWTPERLEQAMAPFLEEQGALVFDHSARFPKYTHLQASGRDQWWVRQTLLTAEGPSPWMVEAEIDLAARDGSNGPLLALVRVSP